ncbi:hypothetical protein KKA15_05915 [Patescibacteria group bacterium]|nr:hypothetical protein [Patescibacteria group bacterium]
MSVDENVINTIIRDKSAQTHEEIRRHLGIESMMDKMAKIAETLRFLREAFSDERNLE